MKKFLLGFTAIALLASCGSGDHGELVGVQNRPTWYPSEPYGMVYIPQGSFTMGNHDEDVPYAYTAPAKVVSVPSFYMDQTEITNNEYRQFVHWVRDSIARVRLAEEFVEDFAWIDLSDMEDPNYFQEYIALEYPDSMTRRLNWDPYLEWDKNRYPDEDYTRVMEGMYLPPNEQWLGYRHIDTRQLNYTFYWIDKQQAAEKRNRYDYRDLDGDGEPDKYEYVDDRSGFFKKETINVYPDTLVWIHDFTYSFNEPMHDKYFWHPAYDDYPVVGVSWRQARAFANWRSKYRRDFLKNEGELIEHDFRLPTEAEWEYAARGGEELTTYPWGGPYATNSSGCYLANFKPRRGNLTADGGFYPVKTTAYNPNGYNLYCMSGNVSEWTSSAFDVQSYAFESDIAPQFEYNAEEWESNTMKRKVIRGGSWKDVAYFMQVGARDFQYQDTATSYIGFRTVQSFLGRDIKDF
jgi:gliding motility-associated lipoprotein GldK